MNTKDEIELIHLIFCEVPSKHGIGHKEDAMNDNCNECFVDCNCEYLFSYYIIAAVKCYFAENNYIVSEKDTYEDCVAHFNCRHDL